MSNIKDIRCKPRRQDLVLAELGRHVAQRRRTAYALAIYAASHFYHEKRVAWAFISLHACDPVPIVMELRLNWRSLGPPGLRYNRELHSAPLCLY